MNKVSDQERRKIAQRLRYELRLMYRDREYYESGKDVVECGNWAYRSIAHSVIPYSHLGNDYIAVVERLVDLIDRETCRNVSGDQNRFECSECGFEMPIWDGDGGWMAFYFCPNCGAEVVSDED